MASSKSGVNEEKLLNDLFVTLEYSDTFKEFVRDMSDEARDVLFTTIRAWKEEGNVSPRANRAPAKRKS